MNQVLQWPGPPEDTWMPMRVLMAFASCVVRWPKLTARVGWKKTWTDYTPGNYDIPEATGVVRWVRKGATWPGVCYLLLSQGLTWTPRPFSILSELGIKKNGFRFQPCKVEKIGDLPFGNHQKLPNQLNWWTYTNLWSETFKQWRSSHHRSTISYTNQLIHRRLWAMTRDTQQGEWQIICLCKMYRKNPSCLCTSSQQYEMAKS